MNSRRNLKEEMLLCDRESFEVTGAKLDELEN